MSCDTIQPHLYVNKMIEIISASIMQPKISPEPEKLIPKPATDPKFDKPAPGSTTHSLDDPNNTYNNDTKTQLSTQQPPSASRLAAATSEVVEEARDRFDRYWSKPAADSSDAK